jgi:hypothetical protein
MSTTLTCYPVSGHDHNVQQHMMLLQGIVMIMDVRWFNENVLLLHWTCAPFAESTSRVIEAFKGDDSCVPPQ